MSKVKVIIFKVYVVIVICFFIAFLFFFGLFVRSKMLNEALKKKSVRYYHSGSDREMYRSITYRENLNVNRVQDFSFIVYYINEDSDDFKSLQKEEREKILAPYPYFEFHFAVADNGYLMSFKDVFFGWLDGERVFMYDDKLDVDFKSSDVPYFKFNKSNYFDSKFVEEYPVSVINYFSISINEALFKLLLKQKTLTITLVSADDAKYNISVTNFLSSDNFSIFNKYKSKDEDKVEDVGIDTF
ncbi:hypothetical protein [Borrelia crocidurae]|uniref:Protein BptA n=1 Tax=Borrelia crocidurae (strain Achema) TaxID=1155096 RepID=I0FEB3_BORCA|nr:hypothetical protein [Borrelia crocidurae]AFI31819.1 hypothetical protein Q7M_1111 [Borrelia crocidurae str. Achema]